MCGFGWAVEIDLRVNHFSLSLPSPAWVVCRPWAFLSLEENKVVCGRGQHFKLVEFNCTNDIELTRKDRGFGGHRLHRSRLGFLLCDEPWHQNELNNRLKDHWGRTECKSKISRSFLSQQGNDFSPTLSPFHIYAGKSRMLNMISLALCGVLSLHCRCDGLSWPVINDLLGNLEAIITPRSTHKLYSRIPFADLPSCYQGARAGAGLPER